MQTHPAPPADIAVGTSVQVAGFGPATVLSFQSRFEGADSRVFLGVRFGDGSRALVPEHLARVAA